ncbi:MAG: hypothetical protein H6711_35200 [Myxococcales bacterium]|nr:hypothetical protein [Myxococcales bacterium]
MLPSNLQIDDLLRAASDGLRTLAETSHANRRERADRLSEALVEINERFADIEGQLKPLSDHLDQVSSVATSSFRILESALQRIHTLEELLQSAGERIDALEARAERTDSARIASIVEELGQPLHTPSAVPPTAPQSRAVDQVERFERALLDPASPFATVLHEIAREIARRAYLDIAADRNAQH